MSLSELGAYLQRHRTEQGLTLEMVEEATRIRRVHLEAIEAGRWDTLPPGVYVRGLLKTYAKTVGLNPETVQRMYLKEQPQEGPPEPREVLSQPLLREPRLSMESVLTVIFIAAAAVIGWWLWQTFVGPMLSVPPEGTPTAVVGGAGATSPAATAPPPRAAASATVSLFVPTPVQAFALASSTPEGTAATTPDTTTTTAAGTATGGATAAATTKQTATATRTATTSPATATATSRASATTTNRVTPSPTPGKGTPTVSSAAGGLRIAVRSAGSVWLRVFMDGSGKAAFEGFLKKGENERWEGQARGSISLRTGNAGDTEVSLNGQRLPALGKTGEVKNVEWRLLPDGRVQQTP